METRLIVAFLKLLALLPLAWLHRLGWLFGRLFSLIPNRERRNAWINLKLCFPELNERERLNLLERSLEQAGRTLLEIAAIWFWPVDRVLAQIRVVSGEDHLCTGSLIKG